MMVRAGMLLAVLLCALSVGAGRPAPAAEPQGGATRQARAVIRPQQQAVLSSEIAARITRLSLREGERFRKGDPLVEFDCRGYQFAQQGAKAALDRFQAKLTAEDALAARRSSGALEVATARADVEKARADHRAASLAVEHCAITAPYDGRVVELKAHAFETVAQHTPLLAILDDSRPEIALVVPAAWLVWLKPGEPFFLDIDETRQSYTGRIVRLGAQIDPVSQTATVYGETDDPDRTLMPGMSGNARFPLNQVSKP